MLLYAFQNRLQKLILLLLFFFFVCNRLLGVVSAKPNKVHQHADDDAILSPLSFMTRCVESAFLTKFPL